MPFSWDSSRELGEEQLVSLFHIAEAHNMLTGRGSELTESWPHDGPMFLSSLFFL